MVGCTLGAVVAGALVAVVAAPRPTTAQHAGHERPGEQDGDQDVHADGDRLAPQPREVAVGQAWSRCGAAWTSARGPRMTPTTSGSTGSP